MEVQVVVEMEVKFSGTQNGGAFTPQNTTE
jgi:hypothetical protein